MSRQGGRLSNSYRKRVWRMEKKNLREYVCMGITAVAVIAVCILLWFSIQHWDMVRAGAKTLMGILAPVIYGAVLAYLISPIYNRVVAGSSSLLQRVWKNGRAVKSISKMLGTAASIAVVLAVIVGMFQMMIPQLLESIMGIRDSLPIYMENLYVWLQKLLSDQTYIVTFENWLEKSFVNIDINRLMQIVTGVSSSLLGILSFIKNWLIGLIVMAYMLNIKDTLTAQGKKIIYGLLNLRMANAVVEELRFVNQMFGGFIIGKLVDSLIIGIICFIGVSLMNMPFPMLLSVIIGVTNVIPFFGPFIGAIPTGFLVLLVSPVKCVYFLIWIFLLQQFDGNILGPKILGNSTGLSSFWVLFSILVFCGLFGFVGMISRFRPLRLSMI